MMDSPPRRPATCPRSRSSSSTTTASSTPRRAPRSGPRELIAEAGGNVHEPIHSVRLPGPRRPPGGDLRRRGPDAHDPPRLDRPPLVHARRPARGAAGRRAARPVHGRARDAALRGACPMDDLSWRAWTRPPRPSSSARARHRRQELVEAAIARVEALNPRAQRGHPRALRARAREAAAGELPDGPFRGVPFLLKDLGAAYAGQPLHLGMQAAQGRRLPRPGRHLPRRSASAPPAS